MSEFYMISTMPFYDSINQCYLKVLTLDRMPDSSAPIMQIVKAVTLSKLSPFQEGTGCNPLNLCGNVLLKPDSHCEYAKIEDIALLFTWLVQNGYHINTNITEMINQGENQPKNPVVCFINR